MTAKIIDGKEISQAVREEYRQRAEKLKDKGILPGLAVIIVGDNPASRIYVRNKIKACHEVGLHSESHDMPEDASEEMVLNQIEELNQSEKIHGILVQLPLPAHIDDKKVLEAISPKKDVDGFHYYNIGALVTGNKIFPPCTPYGVMCMLDYMNIPLEGKEAVVVGRSNIVGKPMALLLLEKSATVTICTSRTQDLKAHTSRADILVVATGRAKMITGDMIKQGATVIDVGINRDDDGRLVGDVEFESASQKAGYITPVPGGVGPMTIAILVANTVLSAERSSGL
ncbi:MAG: bifunctional methylenetetrahydrofolate dehydrogenase/methenyltetrahydrofolate cyclohydrolase FolD [Gammaproteobacteria bacterium]|nr:bifunctional methylenetetrahydrofolate dehydrogenase/methenyltetrahydrofolate cyclohydrolase FolD [Gammaproteobacteria bacterium]